MLIKKLEFGDSKEIHELEKICFPDSYWSNEQIQSHLKNHKGIALQTESAAGYLLYLENIYEVEILRVGVLPSEQKKGYAEKMIHELKSLNKEIFLEVSSENIPALKLYEKSGFQIIYRRKKYYYDGSDALVLKNGIIQK